MHAAMLLALWALLGTEFGLRLGPWLRRVT